jgi:serine/threonine protein kinase
MTALVGTIQYMAPEMLTSASAGRVEYSAAVDVFSFGIVLWQLVTCEQPYAEALATHNRFQLLQRIAREGLRPDVPQYVGTGLRTLIIECWSEAEHARPPSMDLVRRLRLLCTCRLLESCPK